MIIRQKRSRTVSDIELESSEEDADSLLRKGKKNAQPKQTTSIEYIDDVSEDIRLRKDSKTVTSAPPSDSPRGSSLIIKRQRDPIYILLSDLELAPPIFDNDDDEANEKRHTLSNLSTNTIQQYTMLEQSRLYELNTVLNDSWKCMFNARWLLFYCSFGFAILILFDFAGDEISWRHAMWIPGLIIFLMVVTRFTWTRFVVTLFRYYVGHFRKNQKQQQGQGQSFWCWPWTKQQAQQQQQQLRNDTTSSQRNQSEDKQRKYFYYKNYEYNYQTSNASPSTVSKTIAAGTGSHGESQSKPKKSQLAGFQPVSIERVNGTMREESEGNASNIGGEASATTNSNQIASDDHFQL
jgi:hypothetical protein